MHVQNLLTYSWRPETAIASPLLVHPDVMHTRMGDRVATGLVLVPARLKIRLIQFTVDALLDDVLPTLLVWAQNRYSPHLHFISTNPNSLT